MLRKGIKLLIVAIILLQSSTAFAQGVLLVNTNLAEQDNKLILDADNTGGDITLQFGNSLSKYLMWDDTNSYFSFNDDLNLQGNEIKDFRIDNLASAPTCDATAKGRLYHDTTSTNSYVCNGTTWLQIDVLAGGAITGVDSNTFTIDQDNTGGDVSLVFGTTLGEVLQWDDSAQWFYFSDELQVEGDLLPGLDDTYNLGSETLRWKSIYATEGLEIEDGDVIVGEGGFVVFFDNGETGAGNTITVGNVVQIDTTMVDSAILTTSKNDQPVGIAVNDSVYGAEVQVVILGKTAVQCTGTVDIGDLIQSSNTDGKAEAGNNSTKILGSALTTCSGGILDAIVHLE